MKCIYCEKDSNYKDRSDGKCSGCGKPFAFEPKNSDLFTDKAFEAAIKSVSDDGAVRWLPTQLYFELLRRKLKSNIHAKGWTISAVASGGLLGTFIAAGVYSMIPVLGFASLFTTAFAAIGWSQRRTIMEKLSQGIFDNALEKWKAAHGKPKGILEKKVQSAPYREIPEEVLDYSFDRALICDREDIVDFFLANNFHFENNCAILGINDYPHQAFETVLKMLRKNPKLLVIAVHDATPEGCAMAHRLAFGERWFDGKARVVDIGLRPVHAQFFKGLEQRAAQPISKSKGISETDAIWLSKSKLSLDVIRPSQLVKRVFRAIQEMEAMPTSTSSNTTEVMFLGSNAATSDGGGDSFG
jgi:hypothetical protein